MANGKEAPNESLMVVELGPNYVRFNGPFVQFAPPQPREMSEVPLHRRSPQSFSVTSRHMDERRPY